MRIGIDAHILGKQRGGVETCLRSLIGALFRRDRENEYFLYVTRKHSLDEREIPPNFHLRYLPVANPWIERLLVPYFYRRDRLDVIHLQRALPPWGCPHSVLHLHDAIQMSCPALVPRWKRFLFAAIFRSSTRRASYVITPSATSKSEIVHWYGVAPAKVVVVPNGIDRTVYYREEQPALVRQAAECLGVGGPYVIYIGAIERHKNVHLLIRAFAELRRRHPDYKLVIVGRWRAETRRGYTEELTNLVQSLGLGEDIVFAGHVPIEDLRRLLNGAAMLVFPSGAEGFGFPPLEALACGVPAIAADTPVAREVYSDSVLRFVPDSTESLAKTMAALLEDGALRHRLLENRESTLAIYDWDRSSGVLLGVYRLAAEGDMASHPLVRA